jgi:type IV secretory pathway VirB2 component (pilin)
MSVEHLEFRLLKYIAAVADTGSFTAAAQRLHVAQSGGTPFDTGFTSLQNLFTGTIAKVASLIAIVIGGYQFAHGEPGAKKALAGVAAGTGIAVLAVNVLSWLWGI